jgi:hypothetical protein
MTTLAGFAVWGWLRPKPEVAVQPASRLAVVVPNYGGASTAIQRQIAITPDGSTLLFPAIAGDGENRTMRLALDETEPSPLPGIVPFLGDYVMSADGRVPGQPRQSASVPLFDCRRQSVRCRRFR